MRSLLLAALVSVALHVPADARDLAKAVEDLASVVDDLERKVR